MWLDIDIAPDGEAGKTGQGGLAPQTKGQQGQGEPKSQPPQLGQKGGPEMDFSNFSAGTIPAGTLLPEGRIVRSSSTAYQVEGGEWVPFYGAKGVHTTNRWVEPLVTLG